MRAGPLGVEINTRRGHRRLDARRHRGCGNCRRCRLRDDHRHSRHRLHDGRRHNRHRHRRRRSHHHRSRRRQIHPNGADDAAPSDALR